MTTVLDVMINCKRHMRAGFKESSLQLHSFSYSISCGINRIKGWSLHVAPLTKALLCVIQKDELRPLGKQEEVRDKDSFCADLNHEDLYFPSVDLLTAQVHTFIPSPKYPADLLCCSNLCWIREQ